MSQDDQRPRHPDLASAFAGGGERAIFYTNPADGIEVVVARGELLAVRGKGPVMRGPARVLDEHGGSFGRTARALLGDPTELNGSDKAPKRHPRGGRTRIVDILLPKDRFPTQADAAAWLRRCAYRADRIEDNGTVNAGNFWRCHQVDAPAGKPLYTIMFPPAKGREDESRIEALVVVDRPGKGTAKRTAKPSEGRRKRANAKPKATAAATKAATKRSTAGRSAARADAPIVVIACSKTKAGTTKPVAAKDLYASGLFRDSYAYATALTKKGGAIRILSGTHGWVKPTAKIAPQDQTLDGLSARERRAWGKRVLAQMVKEFGAGRRRFVCLAGEKYTDAIKAANPPAAWLCEEPLKGEGIGTRWHHVRRLLAKATRADRAG
jgi:hypothetical protein